MLPTKIGRAYRIMLKASRIRACGDLDMKVNSAPAGRDAVRQGREVDRPEDDPHRQHVALLLFQGAVLDRADDENLAMRIARFGQRNRDFALGFTASRTRLTDGNSQTPTSAASSGKRFLVAFQPT